jgi:hypothetical protein
VLRLHGMNREGDTIKLTAEEAKASNFPEEFPVSEAEERCRQLLNSYREMQKEALSLRHSPLNNERARAIQLDKDSACIHIMGLQLSRLVFLEDHGTVIEKGIKEIEDFLGGH